MAKTESQDRFFDQAAQGTFGKAWELGQKYLGLGMCGERETEFLLFGLGIRQCGFTELGQDNQRWGVYQKRYSHWIKIDGKRKYFGPVKWIREEIFSEKTKRSESQGTRRNLFKSGMTAWKALTSEEKLEYNKNSQKLKLHGVNLFLRNWLKS